MAPTDPSQSSGKQSSQAIESGAGNHRARTDAYPSTSTAVIMQLPAETRPGQFGPPGHETFRYCGTCDAQFEDYDERYGRVIQFCGFCGHRLVRSILGDVNNHIRPVNVSSVESARTPNGPSASSLSRSPIHHGGSHGRRSRSPHTRIRHNGADVFRSSVSNLQGAKRPRSPTIDNISNSQGDKLQNLKYELEPSVNYENKKAKIATKETIVMGGKQGKVKTDSKTIEGGAEKRDSEVSESDVHHSRLPPREDTRRVQAVPQVKMDPDPLAHHQIPARELTHCTPETVEQQRAIERQILAQRLREEKWEKEARNLQKSIKEKEAETESAKTEPTKTEPVKTEPAKKKQVMIDLTMEDK